MGQYVMDDNDDNEFTSSIQDYKESVITNGHQN